MARRFDLIVLIAMVVWPAAFAAAQATDCNGNGVPDDVDLAGKMYWTDWGNDMVNPATPTIRRANLDGKNAEDLVTNGITRPSGIALDLAAGKMYWTDTHIGFGTIQRANLDGTGVEGLVMGLNAPFGIALDVTAGKMYWADGGSGKLQRANLDGTVVENVATMGLSAPFGIALDLVAGKVYWTDYNADKIQRANLDGTGAENLVTTGLTDPLGLALNQAAGKMYWADVTAQEIQRADLIGNSVEHLITMGLIQPQFIALALPVADSDDDGNIDACQGALSGACRCGSGMDGMMVMPMTLLGIGWMRRRTSRRQRGRLGSSRFASSGE